MPPPYKEDAVYKSVRGLSRGLDVLSALNASPRGQSTASELGKLTGLHRTTVRRLLETLADAGYVQRSATDDSFRLTYQVRRLSEGFEVFDRIATVALPVMAELLQQLVWPSSLSLPDIDGMQICESTHRFSRLSFHRSMTGRRLPFLLTASGKAYFSFCQENEQEAILKILREKDDMEGQLARNDKLVAKLIRNTRESGFGTNSGEWQAERKVGSIAMPIMERGQPMGCLNIVYLTHVIPASDAAEKFAQPLASAVQTISDLLASRN